MMINKKYNFIKRIAPLIQLVVLSFFFSNLVAAPLDSLLNQNESSLTSRLKVEGAFKSGGSYKIGTVNRADDDRDRFMRECLPVGEEITLLIEFVNMTINPHYLWAIGIFIDDVDVDFDWNDITTTIIEPNGAITINEPPDFFLYNGVIVPSDTGKVVLEIPITLNVIDSPLGETRNVDIVFNDENNLFSNNDDALTASFSFQSQIGECCNSSKFVYNGPDLELPFYTGSEACIIVDNGVIVDEYQTVSLAAAEYILIDSDFETIITNNGMFQALSIDSCLYDQTDNIAEKLSKTIVSNSKLKIYPNPFTEYLSINTYNFDKEIQSICVYNSIGIMKYRLFQRARHCELPLKEYNLNFLQTGMYFLVIETNSDILIEKIIKH